LFLGERVRAHQGPGIDAEGGNWREKTRFATARRDGPSTGRLETLGFKNTKSHQGDLTGGQITLRV